MARSPQKARTPSAKVHPFFKPKGLTADQLYAQLQQAVAQRDFVGAKVIALKLTELKSDSAMAWTDAAACCVHLQHWQEVFDYAHKALAIDDSILSLYDALSHAYGVLGALDEVRKNGLIALQKRDAAFGKHLFQKIPACVIPAFSENPHKNVIAFSLFGTSSKYGETAVLNAIEQPRLYPHWSCRFYIDDTVPEHVVSRLKQYGATVVFVTPAQRKWPGPMWRMLAYDDPSIERVIFRDADSVISEREAGAVSEWIASDQLFHIMRDAGSHTELILAGLWGCVRGSLPSMATMIEDFLKVEPSSRHFADQYFLREYVWPYVRNHCLQHDSIFGFMDGRPFPQGPYRTDFHTGYAEGSSTFESSVQGVADGTAVAWSLWDCTSEPKQLICRYAGTIQHGVLRAHLPLRYTRKLNTGEYAVTIVKLEASQVK